MRSLETLLTSAALVAAALAIGIPVVRASARDRRDVLREQLQGELASRDVQIAELRGQLVGLKETIESFARAFVDRRNNST